MHPCLDWSATEIARRVAERPDVVQQPDVASRIQRLFQVLYGRQATTSDEHRIHEFLGPQPNAAAWRQLAHALLMANEFAFVD